MTWIPGQDEAVQRASAITDEMVERAALALWHETSAKAAYAGYPYDDLIEVTKVDLRRYARAALEAALTT